VYPDYHYSKEHEWVNMDGDTGTVGITDYAQEQLGDIVFVELPEVGKTFEAGDSMGTIESVKAVSDIYAPVAGEITEVNQALEEKPELINEDAHGGGWIVKMTLTQKGQLEGLMNKDGYEKFLSEEAE
jgi:glycine cleavage system H protein